MKQRLFQFMLRAHSVESDGSPWARGDGVMLAFMLIVDAIILGGLLGAAKITYQMCRYFLY